MKCLIITPTYNEIENIDTMITKTFENVKGLDVTILIVDDNSPDGTAGIVENLMHERFPGNLFILKREGKQGLATAYIAGFQWGLERDFDIFIEMDADLSHNPKYLRDMIALTSNFDAVIGSRYVKGGGVLGWGPIRSIVSKGGSFYSRTILGAPVKDLTGGFNVWTKKVLLAIGLENIISRGYSFQIELKYRAHKLGFSLIDFPIIFENRSLGKSKMSKKIFIEAIMNVWKLKMIKTDK
jgi:dolichol-phosphate mannosyltransferase